MIKKQFLLISFLFSCWIFSQEKNKYFDAAWKETTKTKATFYRPLPLPKIGNLELLRDYYSNGKILQMQAYYADGVEKNYVGDVYWYNPNGNDNSDQQYINRSKHKKLTYYFDDGKIWKTIEYGDSLKHGKTIEYKIDGSILGESIYKNGRLISGTIGNANSNDNNYFRFNKESKNYEFVDIPTSKEAQETITKILYWKNTLKTAVEYKFKNAQTISEKNYDQDGNLIQSLDSLSYYYPERQLKNAKQFYYLPQNRNTIVESPVYIEYKSFQFNDVETRNISHILIYRGTLHFLEKHPTSDKYRETDYQIFSDNGQKFMRLRWDNYSGSAWQEMKDYLDAETKVIPVTDISNLSKDEIYKRFSNKKWKNTDKNITEQLSFISPEYMSKTIKLSSGYSKTNDKESALIYFKIDKNKYLILRENGGFFIPKNSGDLVEIPNFVQD
ncbi:toxin-antitoxin system YwqK family antitoxin [Chryseobacterium sp. TY4]